MLKNILSLIALLLCCTHISAQSIETNAAHEEATAATSLNDDTIYVSMLTCSPGDEIHRLYGHTALRLITPSEDWAVNFGWFSFNTPNFVMKFILGLTDYSMAYQTMPIFITDMVQDNMPVREQQLNLTTEEAHLVSQKLKEILDSKGYERYNYLFRDPRTGGDIEQTILGAKWTYRYNFLYDNCTTRAVECIREALKANGEELVFPTLSINQETRTQRQMIHEFTRKSPWYEFGQDVLLGPEVDETHSIKELSQGLNFLPTYAEDFFEQAQIRDKKGGLRPLVNQKVELTPFLTPKEHRPAVPFTPLAVAGIVLGFALIITMFERKANLRALQIGAPTAEQRAWRIWGNAFDFTAWTLQGIVGILLVIMVGWSEHPAVGTNWLLFFFNPLFFLGIPARLIKGKFERIFAWYATAMALAIILVGAFGLQQIPYAIYPLAIASALRAKVTPISDSKP